MEIANNLIPTLSAADSPSQLSEGNPPAKNAKKKAAGEESFDASLNNQLNATMGPSLSGATTLVPGASADANVTLSKEAGKLAGDAKTPTGPNVADQVALSKQAVAQAARSSGAPAPTVASLFQAKAEQNAAGTIAGAFVAGPDQPWNSRWVFGPGNQPRLEGMNAAQDSGTTPNLQKSQADLEQLKKLIVSAQGGDESQLKQAAEGTLAGIDSAIGQLSGQLNGELQSVRTEVAPGAPKGQLGALGGAEYLSALQGAKAVTLGQAGQGSLGGQMNQDGSSAGGPGAFLANPPSMKGGVAGAKPELQVIQGGNGGGLASAAGRLEGGARLLNEEGSLDGGLKNDVMLPAGVPLSAALHRTESHGIPPQMITGHVVPGSMMRDRLTSQSVRDMSNGIQNMSAAGGGEMRIRLNPGNLGELMIRVSTNGKDVGLKVQATDHAAKKVIEESLGSLRESLAQQSLALGRVDVTLAASSSQSADMGSNQQGSNPFAANSDGQHGRFQSAFGGGEEKSPQSGERGAERSGSQMNAVGHSARIASMGSAGRAGSNSRLDVIA